MNPQFIEDMRQEFHRGTMALMVLSELQEEHYGYTLRKALARHGVAIDDGTMYPLLRRFEAKGFIEGEWREAGNRRRCFYRLSPEGREFLRTFREEIDEEWQYLKSVMEGIS